MSRCTRRLCVQSSSGRAEGGEERGPTWPRSLTGRLTVIFVETESFLLSWRSRSGETFLDRTSARSARRGGPLRPRLHRRGLHLVDIAAGDVDGVGGFGKK